MRRVWRSIHQSALLTESIGRSRSRTACVRPVSEPAVCGTARSTARRTRITGDREAKEARNEPGTGQASPVNPEDVPQKWLPRPGWGCSGWMTSDSVGKAKALELYGYRRTNSLTISSVSVRHFRPHPNRLGVNLEARDFQVPGAPLPSATTSDLSGRAARIDETGRSLP